jgi:hypothetical protein
MIPAQNVTGRLRILLLSFAAEQEKFYVIYPSATISH